MAASASVRETDAKREWSLALAGLIGAAAASLALALVLTDEVVLSFDDLVFFGHAQGYELSNLLDPHGGHIVLGSRLLFAGAMDLLGPSDFAALTVLLRVFVVVTVVILFALLSRRVRPLAALAPCAVILFFGTSWTVSLGPGTLAVALCTAAGLGALLALDADVDDRRGRRLAAGFLTVSVASWAGGLAFVAAVAARLAAEPGRTAPRLWVPALPLLLYIPWVLWKDPTGDQGGEISLSNLVSLFEVAAISLSATIGGLLGVAYDSSSSAEVRVWVGAPFAALAVAGFAWRVSRRPLPPTLWGFIALLVSYWGLLALSQSADREPDDARHLFFPALVVVLIGADLLRGVRISAGALTALYAVTAISLAANVSMLVNRGEYLRGHSETLRAEMSAIELERSRMPPDFLPLDHGGVMNIPAGDYLAAIDRYGSPVSAERDLAASDPEVRAHAKRLISAAGGSRRETR